MKTETAKHTPGLWRVCGGSTPAYSAITSNDGYVVFSMADRVSDMEHGKPIKAPDYDTQRANAKRIVACVNACRGIVDPSAVPELLEACRWFVSQFEGESGAGANYWREHAEFRNALAAIRKATTQPD